VGKGAFFGLKLIREIRGLKADSFGLVTPSPFIQTKQPAIKSKQYGCFALRFIFSFEIMSVAPEGENVFETRGCSKSAKKDIFVSFEDCKTSCCWNG